MILAKPANFANSFSIALSDGFFSLLRFLTFFLSYDLLSSMKKNKTLTYSSKATAASVFKLISDFTAYLKIQAKLS